ncbi:hypothetical protein AX17_003883 [Amanita inopinata Kibby_2008]|nr:hypothetical protein AX17_003883 [Amanita inopinata Kibby_2008]
MSSLNPTAATTTHNALDRDAGSRTTAAPPTTTYFAFDFHIFLTALPRLVFTLNIPLFYESRGRGPDFGLQGAISTWKAVRAFAALLLGVMVSALFKASARAGTSFWFFGCSSAMLAFIGLAHSNILIFYFSRDPLQLVDDQNAEALSFSFHSIWDLFALPAIWTTWSFMTFIISTIIAIIHPDVLRGNPNGPELAKPITRSLDPGQTILILLFCVSIISFVVSSLHLHRLVPSFA